MCAAGCGHIPVMLEEALAWLAPRPGGTYVDCTAGAGGHSEAIAQRIEAGRLIALDRDADAAAAVGKRLEAYPNVRVLHRNYAELAAVLDALGIAEVDGILLDAGLSSVQLDTPERGFSFQAEGPLDMRMDRQSGMTAAQWLAQVEPGELARVLKDYGDVGPAKRIAKAIKDRCAAGRMATTRDLRGAVCESLDFVKGEPEEVRTVFQAVRMAVNGELAGLERVLREGALRLAPGGRFVVIAFHSGEDRVVKSVFRELSRKREELYPDGRVRKVAAPMLKVLTGAPLTPEAEETARNPRAKSAKMRVAERLTVGNESQRRP